jgi:hypothetical protein
MWLIEHIRELIAAMFAAAFIVFTGMRMIPIEVFIGVASAVITYYFQEKSKDSLKHEIAMLKAGNNSTKEKI